MLPRRVRRTDCGCSYCAVFCPSPVYVCGIAQAKHPRKVLPKIWRTVTLSLSPRGQLCTTVRLPPGRYAYRYIVDNRPFFKPEKPIRKIVDVTVIGGKRINIGRRGKLSPPIDADEEFNNEVSE